MPYESDINDIIAKSMNRCIMKKKVCFDRKLGGAICKTIEFPCTPSFDINNDDVATLHFGNDNADPSYLNISNIDSDSIQSAVQTQFYKIAERANLIGSFYCFYIALMVFLGPPYILTSYKMSTKIQMAMGTLSRPWFIVLVLILVYSAEIAQFLYSELFVDLNLLQIIEFTLKDPCFGNGDFMKLLFQETARICGDIESSRRSFDASRHNLDYYKSIEDSYEYYYWQQTPSGQVKYKESDRLCVDDVLGHHGTFVMLEV